MFDWQEGQQHINNTAFRSYSASYAFILVFGFIAAKFTTLVRVVSKPNHDHSHHHKNDSHHVPMSSTGISLFMSCQDRKMHDLDVFLFQSNHGFHGKAWLDLHLFVWHSVHPIHPVPS